MPKFKIEMGQGILAGADVLVTTSALYSCTFITGRNAAGRAGAYHYPADSLGDDDVLRDMDTWAAILRPTSVTLIFAMQNLIFGTSPADQLDLRNWVFQRCGVVATSGNATAAGMALTRAHGFEAGSIGALAADFNIGEIDVTGRDAGRYLDQGGFTLIGEDRN